MSQTPQAARSLDPAAATRPLPDVTPVERRRAILALARAAARRDLDGSAVSLPQRWPPEARRFGGVFVTYWSGPVLRGCVGTFVPTSDLWNIVKETAVAALKDPRFSERRITGPELLDINIEVSLLSELVKSGNPLADLRPGVHGVLVRLGERSGCFLPKVAEHRRWTADELLSNCCTMKAGLVPDAWRSPEAQVHLFSAEVFCEADLPAPVPPQR